MFHKTIPHIILKELCHCIIGFAEATIQSSITVTGLKKYKHAKSVFIPLLQNDDEVQPDHYVLQSGLAIQDCLLVK